jgi:hypothetical protein
MKKPASAGFFVPAIEWSIKKPVGASLLAIAVQQST